MVSTATCLDSHIVAKVYANGCRVLGLVEGDYVLPADLFVCETDYCIVIAYGKR